ncbi:hypothetical protein D3C73_658860 [compost metagenome]
MFRPTFLNTCTTMTEIIAVVSSLSQFGPSMPNVRSMPLMPPFFCRRKPQTIVQATNETTTGEKNRVRKIAMPASFWFSSTASSKASDRLKITSPAEKIAVAPSTSRRLWSSISIR